LDSFELSDDAIVDIEAIWLFLLGKEGLEKADQVVTDLFKIFYKLSDVPHSGHRRPDLTSRQVLLYRVFSYLIVYDPQSKPLRIFGVLHGRRDILRILKERL
jgi:antitoxin ParD1/3/4/toxin ParE1/3/4